MATQIQQILRNETVTLATPGFSKPGYAIAGWVTEDHVKSGTPDY